MVQRIMSVGALMAALLVAINGCASNPARKPVASGRANLSGAVPLWTKVPIERRDAIVYIKTLPRYPEVWAHSAEVEEAGYGEDSKSRAARERMVKLVQLILKPAKPADPNVRVGSVVETWEVDCSEKVGAQTSTAVVSEDMGEGLLMKVDDFFPTVEDYTKTSDVKIICDFLRTRAARNLANNTAAAEAPQPQRRSHQP